MERWPLLLGASANTPKASDEFHLWNTRLPSLVNGIRRSSFAQKMHIFQLEDVHLLFYNWAAFCLRLGKGLQLFVFFL